MVIVFVKLGILLGSYKPKTGFLKIFTYLLSIMYFLISFIKFFGSSALYPCLMSISFSFPSHFLVQFSFAQINPFFIFHNVYISTKVNRKLKLMFLSLIKIFIGFSNISFPENQ